MAQEFSNLEKRFCTYQKWASLQALTLPKQSDFTQLSDDSKAYIYILVWWALTLMVSTACDTVCLWLRDKARLFRCSSWWVLLVCSGVPVGGYCPSHGTSVIAQPSLLTYTSWRVWLARGGGWGVSPNTTKPIDVHQVKGMAGQGCVGGECHPTQPSLLTYTR